MQNKCILIDYININNCILIDCTVKMLHLKPCSKYIFEMLTMQPNERTMNRIIHLYVKNSFENIAKSRLLLVVFFLQKLMEIRLCGCLIVCRYVTFIYSHLPNFLLFVFKSKSMAIDDCNKFFLITTLYLHCK